jgi:glycyl-tRNA synthetase
MGTVVSAIKTLEDNLAPLVALCKRRGFIYPGSEIYGGFANTYSYGPYGAELKKNVKDLWWKTFVQQRRDMVGLDGPILLHPRAWEASGHVESFSDALVDCKECKCRFRVDVLVEEAVGIDVEGFELSRIDEIIEEKKIACPNCKKTNFTKARKFNLMFQTQLSKVDAEGSAHIAYLRPETAQAIFLDFKNITDTMRVKVPFGVGQIGKAFRNEITPGNFVFRVVEFEQMEIEYFIQEKEWEKCFEEWLDAMWRWCEAIGLSKGHLHNAEHPKDKLSHYSKRTVDITYDFPFGTKELYGLAYRTDYDLKRHQEYSGERLDISQLDDPKQRYVPHVIEPTFGVDRTILALLCEAYAEEELENGEKRTVLRFLPHMAPVKAAVFPLMKKEPLDGIAKQLFTQLQSLWNVEYDDSGNIGKRYRRQDELGTPFCITVDYQTVEDNTVTVRDRDTMQQQRIPLGDVVVFLAKELTAQVR